MKKIRTIGLKLLLLSVPFFIAIPIAMIKNPMYFYDGEYSWYRENKEYSEDHNEYCRVLIMGDSTAKAGWMPEELSEDTYNFSLGGASPIEEYYYLLEYLENNKDPEFLIYTQGASHFLEAETLWSRSIYFHRMDINEISSFINTALPRYERALRTNKNEAAKEAFLYKTYSPIKYGPAFVKGLLNSGRYAQNLGKYTEVIENKGQAQFGTAPYCDDENYYTEFVSFEVNAAIDFYFKMIIELCEDNGIQFIFQNPPLNRASYCSLKPRFVKDYRSYLESLQKRYPDAFFDMELFCYENNYFGDPTHLNRQGTIMFSREMRNKYNEVFD